MSCQILFIEDEVNLLNSLSFILEQQGYSVLPAQNGEKGLEIVEKTTPDLVLLDITLPGIDGFQVAQKLKSSKKTENIPIVMLTGSQVEDDMVKALDNFAVDYITKPIRPRVLISRLKAVFRKMQLYSVHDTTETVLESGNIRLDLNTREVFVSGIKTIFTKTEFDLLKLFIKRSEKVVSRSGIIEQIYGDDYSITERAVDFQVYSIRKKLGKEGSRIESVRSIGYILRI
jgi:two-component system phosphate regulon response regulator PhoB